MSSDWLATGASYEKAWKFVPIADASVICTECIIEVPSTLLQITCVLVVQTVVVHRVAPTRVDGVASEIPKLRPCTVTCPMPEVGMLTWTDEEMAGASYEKEPVSVPNRDATVTTLL